MPALQTTYANTLTPAVAGMEANMETKNNVSRTVETAAGIGFGLAVSRGTNDNGCVIGGANYLGVSLLDTTRVADLYAQYDTAAIMTKGLVWVSVTVAVTQGQPAYYVPATGVITNVTTSNTAIPNAVFDSTTAGAGLAKLRLG